MFFIAKVKCSEDQDSYDTESRSIQTVTYNTVEKKVFNPEHTLNDVYGWYNGLKEEKDYCTFGDLVIDELKV